MKTNSHSNRLIPLLLLLICWFDGPMGLNAQENQYIVTNSQDSGEGSLRKALIDAGTDTGIAVILFNIPKTDPGFKADTGVWTIAPASPLSGISGNHIVINGISQSDFIGEDSNPFGPEIEISGKNAGYAVGFYVNQCSIEFIHLIINGFADAGIFLSNLHHAMVAGCYIGTGPDGWENKGNYTGIYISDKCKNVHIIPLDTVPNVIGGNTNGGIVIHDSSTNNIIHGNIIGLTRDHMEVIGQTEGRGIELWNHCDSNHIMDNWIGGNKVGIGIYSCFDNEVVGNRIGTDPDWTQDIGNSGDGIEIMQGSKRNLIVGNWIGNSSRDGVRVDGNETMYNTITENSISGNESKGIGLVNGANGGLSAPVFTTGDGNEIMGKAAPYSTIEIFTDGDDEGRIIQAVVLADSAGNFGWAGSLAGPFDSIRATATDTLGNTSEFGFYRPGGEPTSVGTTNDPVPFSLIGDGRGSFPEIMVQFNLPANMEVHLDVFNMGGQKVAGIHKGKLRAGFHSITWKTTPHKSGIYLIRMQTSRGALTRKCVVAK